MALGDFAPGGPYAKTANTAIKSIFDFFIPGSPGNSPSLNGSGLASAVGYAPFSWSNPKTWGPNVLWIILAALFIVFGAYKVLN